MKTDKNDTINSEFVRGYNYGRFTFGMYPGTFDPQKFVGLTAEQWAKKVRGVCAGRPHLAAECVRLAPLDIRQTKHPLHAKWVFWCGVSAGYLSMTRRRSGKKIVNMIDFRNTKIREYSYHGIKH